MPATLIEPDTRQQILDQISHHEAELIRLREQLRQFPAIKTFFVYRCRPGNQLVWVYALNEDEATQKLHERMDRDYGPGNWEIAIKRVDKYTDPDRAASDCRSGNIFKALTERDAIELAADYRETERQDPKARRLKNVPASQFERDLAGLSKSSG